MKTLKHEEVDASAYRDVDEARASIGNFIEQIYNQQRLHSALDYLSPQEYETKLPRSQPGVPPVAIVAVETCP